MLIFRLHPLRCRLPAVLGLALARHLHSAAALGDTAAYMLQCAYAAKLSMLVLPEARLTVPVLGVLLAAAPPLLLHGSGVGRDGMTPRSPAPQTPLLPSRRRVILE